MGKACDGGHTAEEVIDGLRAQYLTRLHRFEVTADDEPANREPTADGAPDLVLHRQLIGVQRHSLAALHQEGHIGITKLRTMEHELDLDEARLPPE